jgi:hypothetical protein
MKKKLPLLNFRYLEDSTDCNRENPMTVMAAERTTLHSAAAGQVQVPLRGYFTMVKVAANIWNACPALRAAKSLPEARSVAKAIARGVPL